MYIASTEQNREADPRGEFFSAKHADPIYALFGLSGLGVEQMPSLNEPVDKTIGYHIRTGKHDVTDYDLDQYLCFADRHFGQTSPSACRAGVRATLLPCNPPRTDMSRFSR